MKSRKLAHFAFLFVFLAALGCSEDPEIAARKMFNEAMTAQQSQNNTDAYTIYRAIVAKYPGTETAVEANQILLKRSKELSRFRSGIRNALDLFRLENGRYPSTEEGLQALVDRPSDYPHWKGPYLNASAKSVIGEFNYSLEGKTEIALEPY